MLLYLAEGNIFELQGQYTQAESVLRRGLGNIDDDIAAGVDDRATAFFTLGDLLLLLKAEFHEGLARVLSLQDRLTEAEIEMRYGLQTLLRRFGRGLTVHRATT